MDTISTTESRWGTCLVSSFPSCLLSLPCISSANHTVTLLHSFPTRDMADQSGFTCFRARFQSVLQSYGQTTGITLAEHPLAMRIQNCHSAECITAILKHEARSSDLLRSDRSMKSVESAVSILSTLSATASLGDSIGLVRKGH
jgi:hypothetical protein